MFIRKEQVEALSEAGVRGFEEEMVGRFRGARGDDGRPSSDDEVRERVRAGIRRAAGYGVGRRFDVRRYLDAMFALAFDRADSPWRGRAEAVMSDDSLPLLTKLERLDAYVLLGARDDAGGDGP
ncbi:MAG TPA: hypothetical protein VER08_08080 [Pyrinomonadaceae bacterium]|nr:hypothetical protein [Pyrinomonadaceae bacterium]